MSDTSLSHLEPKSLWSHFDQLRKIPRPSRHEEQVIAHVKKWAAERKYEVKQDKIGNLCVLVPATPGHEKARTIILQGHLDMVAEADKTTKHDFLKDPIPVKIDGDWVVAPLTTLGADNGIGVATAMASADDPTVVHGPMELLFTIDEETALTGASNLEASLLTGHTLLNLDSEEDGTLFVGCAGGCTVEIALPIKRTHTPAGYTAVRMEITGLKGGHSGLMIHENRGNSLKILARILERWGEKHLLHVDSMEGGNKHNAIPREAAVTVALPRSFLDEARGMADKEGKRVLTEIGTIDPDLSIRITEVAEGVGMPLDADTTQRLVRMLVGLPHGVITMSRDIPGLVETSCNLGVARTDKEHIVITTSCRSSVEAALDGILSQTHAVAVLAGASPKDISRYPGWQPIMTSPLLKVCKDAHKQLRSNDPKVTAIHAGLECGIIGEKLGGGMDMISYGPELMGVHAPGEKVNIKSVARYWEFHKAVLKQLA